MSVWASGQFPQEWLEQYGGREGDGAEERERRRREMLMGPVQQPGLPPGWQGRLDQATLDQIQGRGNQQNAYNMMLATAMGGSTPQQRALQQGFVSQGNAAMSQASGARGGARGYAASLGAGMQATNEASGLNSQILAQQKAQDQITATNMLQKQAAQQRQAELQNLGLGYDQAFRDAQLQTAYRGLNDQNQLWGAGVGHKIDLAKMGYASQAADLVNQFGQQQTGRDLQMYGALANMGAGAAQGAGNLFADGSSPAKRPGPSDAQKQLWAWEEYNSDERKKSAYTSDERKKDPHDGVADSLLDALAKAQYTYTYKDPADEPRSVPTGGNYLGVSAQEMEKIPRIGQQLVRDSPDGKKMELAALVSALSGGLGRVHERVRQLEGGRGGNRSR